MSTRLLSRRALNRATLARQHLLERTPLEPLAAIEHLVGLQAQVPENPYTALWSRLRDFRPDDLSTLLLERRAVRIVTLRGTLHLVTADDCLLLRPLAQPVLDDELRRHRDHAPKLRGIGLAPVLAYASELLAEPHTGPQLRDALAARFPQHDARALAYACRNHLALVQVPPRGLWGRSAQPCYATAESWLGRPLVEQPSLDGVVLRYLAAFGPASVADIGTWSRLTGLRAVVERLRPQLATFRDERGRELFDLPRAPRPDENAPAPPRFLPEYDNLLLSHQDRARFVVPEVRAALRATARIGDGSVLVGGAVRALWRLERQGDRAELVIRHAGRFAQRTRAAVAAEARRLLRFLAPDSEPHVRFDEVAA